MNTTPHHRRNYRSESSHYIGTRARGTGKTAEMVRALIDTYLQNMRLDVKQFDPLARYDLIPAEVLRKLAICYGIGFEKHSDRWQQEGYKFTDNLASIRRHLQTLDQGVDIDPEDGQSVAMAIAFRVFAHEWYLAHRLDLDDRHV